MTAIIPLPSEKVQAIGINYKLTSGNGKTLTRFELLGEGETLVHLHSRMLARLNEYGRNKGQRIYIQEKTVIHVHDFNNATYKLP